MNEYLHESFEFISLSPANGKVYHSKKFDQTVIIYSNKIKFYFNRINKNHYHFPVNYYNSVIINTEE